MSWRDNSSSDTRSSTSDSRGGSSSSGGGSSGGGGGLGLTTGKVTGNKAYGKAGGTAVGMGAPGFGTPEETARTLARMRQVTLAPQPVAAPPRPVAAPVVAPPPAPVTYPGFLGPNSPLAQASLPQVGGTVPSEIQQGINFTTQGPTSMPGSPVGPQIGGVTTVNGVGGDRGSWATPGAQPGQTRSPTAPSAPSAPSAPAATDQSRVQRHLDMGKPIAPRAEQAPDRRFNVGVMDTPRAFQDPTNGIGQYPGAGVPEIPSAPGMVKDQSRIPPGIGMKDIYDRLPGMEGPTAPTPAYNPRMVGNAAYTPQALNDIRHNNGWVPNPVDTPRPENGVQPVNYRTDWNWTGLGQMDKTGQTVTPRTKPNSVFGPTFGPETPAGGADWQQGIPNPASSRPRTPAGGLMRSLGGRG